MNIEALCAAPPEALAHSPSQVPLSCPVVPQTQLELHKDAALVGARRPGPEGQVLRHILRYVLRNALSSALRRVLHVPVLHVSQGGVGGGMRVLGVGSAAGR